VILGVVLALAAGLYGSAHLLTGRYAWARAVAWMESDIEDRHRSRSERFPAPRSAPCRRGPPGG
jgi:hypothetical protein